jgi:hypothetical protein
MNTSWHDAIYGSNCRSMKKNKLTVFVLAAITITLVAGVGWCIVHAPTMVPSIPLILAGTAALVQAIRGSGGGGASGGRGRKHRTRH